MYSFISPEGKTVRTKSLRKFADTYSLNYGCVAQLSCGYRGQVKGWHNTHPKNKASRKRFTTKLINLSTGEIFILGGHITKFAKRHNLHSVPFGELIRGKRKCYKNWMLYSAYEAISELKMNGSF